MYRDEVLAISEGVVDAYRKGVEEGKRDVGPYIIGLEQAVKELGRVVSDLARKDVRVVGDTEEDIELVNAKNKDLAEILNRLIRDAKSAIDASGVRHLRRDAWWDGVPF